VIEKLFKIILFIFSPFCFLGFGKVIVQHFEYSLLKSYEFISFAGGVLIFFILWILFLAHRDSFWRSLEHELTHAIFATLFLKKVTTLAASRRTGGKITIEGGNFIIALSPYFFPLVANLFTLGKLIIFPKFLLILNFMIGFTWMHHFLNLFYEFDTNQPDIKSTGIWFSLFIISFFYLFFFGIIFFSINGNEHSILVYWQKGFQNSINYLDSVYFIFRNIIFE
jgi:hypothetical protein